jgi:hypothetical protein
MTRTPVGNAADESDPVATTRARREANPARRPDDVADVLLDAIRRGLEPGDPVAGLLAGWTAPPARALPSHPTRRAPDEHSAPA